MQNDNAANGRPVQEHADADSFRVGMSMLAGACTIITTRHGDERAGLTATAVCSVTADPPQLMVCLNRNVRAYELVVNSRALNVNVLAADQIGLAQRFAGMVKDVRGTDRFLEGGWEDGMTGAPVLRDALVSFECRVAEIIPASTHGMFLCDVVRVNTAPPETASLLYYNRRFMQLDPAA